MGVSIRCTSRSPQECPRGSRLRTSAALKHGRRWAGSPSLNPAAAVAQTIEHRRHAFRHFLQLRQLVMPPCTAARVARRFLGSTTRTAVVAHVDPPGYSWGWFADDTPRMHLVPLEPEHRGAARVWLEDRGIRSFQVDYLTTDSDLDLDQLRESVRRTRDTIESAWLRSCDRRGWLAYSPRDVMVAIYFGTSNQLVRTLHESRCVPEYLQLDIETNSACLEVRANRLIWWGADDGSDAHPTSAI
jgi:hypothetical protein